MKKKYFNINRYKNLIIVIIVCLFWFSLTIISWINPAKDISESERRKLEQLPRLELQSMLSGKFMKNFEEYAKDQFPGRFGLRKLKAFTRFYLLSQKDNNGIYIEDDYAAKLEYPLNESSIHTANDKFRYLYEKYMFDKDVKLYFSVIPDKNYYSGAQKGYPSMDYEQLFRMVRDGTDYARYIDITDMLSLEDYYRTDIHWRQENIDKIAKKIGSELGIADYLSPDFETVKVDDPFYGVYYGQSALPLKPDQIIYLTNDTIKNCTVYNVESDSITPVYDLEKLEGRDPYDVYLSGASPLLIIENPAAKTDRELVVFRDSFGSSLVPLLLEGYSRVTMVDIRYITSDSLGSYIEFNNQDVLFLYSTTILNSAVMLR